MADRAGDKSKQPPECGTHEHPTHCPHLVDVTPRAMDRETYDCTVCGEHFTLYYEDMA
jgi:hypothetical protein